MDPDMTPRMSPRPRRRLNRLAAVGLVAAGTLLAACSSSSTSATTTAPSGGTLSGNNAAYIAADLNAPAEGAVVVVAEVDDELQAARSAPVATRPTATRRFNLRRSFGDV